VTSAIRTTPVIITSARVTNTETAAIASIATGKAFDRGEPPRR
jgi:hypothetical protein